MVAPHGIHPSHVLQICNVHLLLYLQHLLWQYQVVFCCCCCCCCWLLKLYHRLRVSFTLFQFSFSPYILLAESSLFLFFFFLPSFLKASIFFQNVIHPVTRILCLSYHKEHKLHSFIEATFDKEECQPKNHLVFILSGTVIHNNRQHVSLLCRLSFIAEAK